MGLTRVTTTIRKLAGGGKGFSAEFLVDTGAVDCLAPAKALRSAGIKPEGKNVYELADGRPVELQYGFARVSLLGQETVTPIIFGPDDSEPIFGVLALEGLGISVDPKTCSLEREQARSLKRSSRLRDDSAFSRPAWNIVKPFTKPSSKPKCTYVKCDQQREDHHADQNALPRK